MWVPPFSIVDDNLSGSYIMSPKNADGVGKDSYAI